MKLITISSKGDFIYEKNNHKVLELKFKGWLSNKAQTKYNNKELKIYSKNSWGYKFKILEDEIEKGSINFNWKNDILICFKDHNKKELIFNMKSKGFWKSRYEIVDQNKNLIITIFPKMNWKKLKQNYKILEHSNNFDKNYLDELIIFCGFSVIIYNRKMASIS
jgi:hypothetical protein